MTLGLLERRYLGADRFVEGNVKRGETFSVDSNLGGSFVVEYAGHFAGQLLFERKQQGDFPPTCYWYANETDAAQHVFILVEAT